jgi:hypothetical protein
MIKKKGVPQESTFYCDRQFTEEATAHEKVISVTECFK